MSMALTSVNPHVDRALQPIRDAQEANKDTNPREVFTYVRSRSWIFQGRIFAVSALYGSLGAGIGYNAAGFITSLVCPPAAPSAALAGAAVGGALGLAYGTRESYIQIKGSEKFADWKLEAQKKGIYQIFERFIDSKEYDEFLCSIDKSLCDMPVTTPGKPHIYNYPIIAQWISLRGTHPLTGEAITVKDLIYDNTYHQKLMNKLMPKIQKGEIKEDAVLEGVDALYSTAEANNSSLLRSVSDEDFQQVVNGTIDKEKFFSKLTVIIDTLRLPVNLASPKAKIVAKA